MFSFFLKQPEKQSANPITETFAGASQEQKFSVMSLIITSCGDDEDEINTDEEYVILSYGNMLNVQPKDSLIYLGRTGRTALIKNLKALSASQKDMVITMVYGATKLRPNQSKARVSASIAVLLDAGISEDHFMNTIEKYKAFMNIK